MFGSDATKRENGWALLAIRMAEIRRLSGHRGSIGEMCECYSIAVLHLRQSKDIGPGTEYISEYEELIACIEQEVHYYLTVSARQSA
jgi:hypothetical protein